MIETSPPISQTTSQPEGRLNVLDRALTSAEKSNLQNAFRDFSTVALSPHVALGETIRHIGPRHVKKPDEITQVGPDIQRVKLPHEGTYLQVTAVTVEKQEAGFVSTDPFTQFVLNNANLSPESKEAIAQYAQGKDSDGNPNRIVLIRSEKPSMEFRHAFRKHTNEYNGGIAFLTQASAIIDGLGSQSEEAAISVHDQKTAEKASLHHLVDLANNGKSIHFSALTPGESGQIPQEVQHALQELNLKIKPYEFVYWTLSALSERQRREQVAALGLLMAGLALPEGLERMGGIFSEVLRQGPGILTQLSKDLAKIQPLQQLLGTSGVTAPQLSEKAIEQLTTAMQQMTGSVGGDMVQKSLIGKGSERINKVAAKMGQFIGNNVEKISKDKFFAHKVVACCAILGVPAAAIGLTALTGLTIVGSPLFILASPIVGTTLLATEVHKRMKMNPKSQEEVRELLGAYLSKSPRLAQFFARKFPKSTLALYDIAKNPTAVGGWLGTLASVPAIILLNTFLPSPLSLPLTVAASTFICEGSAGTIAGTRAVFRDPWRYFESELPRVEQMIRFGREGKRTPSYQHKR